MADAHRRERLLVISHFYEPEPNFISADVASRLADEFDVVALVPHPNYPLDSVYPGTRFPWWLTKSIERGVTVWRFPVIPYHGRSHLRRALCYLSFAAPAAALAPFLGGRPRVVWVYLGPFFAALAAIPFKLLSGARLVFTYADLWPESLVAAGVASPGLEVRALLAYRRALNRLADAIICSTRGTLERFASEGIPRDRLHYVPVWIDLGETDARGRSGAGSNAISSDGRANRENDGVAHIVYAGNMGPAQRLDTLVLAAEQLQRRGVGVIFDLYGSGSEEAALRRAAERRGLSNVRFHGRVPASVAFEVAAAAFAQLVSLEPSPLFAMTVPSKLAACFAAGAPLLYGLTGEARDLATAANGGLPFDARDPASLTEAVEALLALPDEDRRRMSESLKCFSREHFQQDDLLQRSCAIIKGTTTE